MKGIEVVGVVINLTFSSETSRYLEGKAVSSSALQGILNTY